MVNTKSSRRVWISAGIASLVLAAGLTQLPIFAFDSDGGMVASPFSYSCGRVSTIWQYGISSDGSGREGGELRDPNQRRDASCSLQFTIANGGIILLGLGGLAAIGYSTRQASRARKEVAVQV